VDFFRFRDLKKFFFQISAKLPGPFQLICRLIVFMNGAPQNAQLNARAKESINLFGELFFWLNNKFCETDSPFPKIIGHLLESLQKGFFFNFFKSKKFFFKNFRQIVHLMKIKTIILEKKFYFRELKDGRLLY